MKLPFLLLLPLFALSQVFTGGDGSGSDFNSLYSCFADAFTSTSKASGFAYKGFFPCSDNYRYTSSGISSGFNSVKITLCDSTPGRFIFHSDTTYRSGFNYSSVNYCQNHVFAGQNYSGFSYGYINYCLPLSYMGSMASGFSISTGICLSPQPVPVRWLHISALPLKNSVLLVWDVIIEDQCNYFEVNKFISGDFRPIGEVLCLNDGHSKQTYFFEDKNPLLGPNYYVVHQIDMDGNFQESEVVVTVFTGMSEVENLTIYPNPARNRDIVNLWGIEPGTYEIEIFDVSYSLKWKFTQESNLEQIRVALPSMSDGIYFILLKNDHRSYMGKIFIQSK